MPSNFDVGSMLAVSPEGNFTVVRNLALAAVSTFTLSFGLRLNMRCWPTVSFLFGASREKSEASENWTTALKVCEGTTFSEAISRSNL